MNNDPLEKLLTSKKYGGICPDTVRRVWEDCSRRYKKPKDAEKAAREALHGIAGAFLTNAEAAECAWAMQAWHAGGRTGAQLENILNKHASTRERLPLEEMEALYARIFEITGRPSRVLDLACGINPLYLGARDIETVGVDISGGAVEIVNAFGENYGLPVRAVCADLLCPGSIPREHFALALLFKVLPLLERQRSGAALDVLRAVNADSLAVSFPTRSLGGRNVGMAAHYSQWMEANVPEGRRVAGRFETKNELFYILSQAR